jgi:uncharacterized membrane protein
MFLLFKYLHIVAAMIWIGGVVTLVVINARLASSHNKAAVQAFAQQGAFYGRAVLGPAAAITLLAGIATTVFMRMSFGALWILCGFAGILGSMIVGAVFIRRTTEELGQIVAAPSPDPAAQAVLQKRLVTLNTVNLVLLLSTIAAMVFKPML